MDVVNRLGPRLVGSERIDYHLITHDKDDLEKGDGSESCEAGGDTEYPSSRWVRGIRRQLPRLLVLAPSFLQRRGARKEPWALHKTAWLDGLRGVAAFFVVWHHMSLLWFSWDIHRGWASFEDPLIQLPIVRMTISGLPNVMVFFVISGYALSYKPLRLLGQDQHAETYRALASSAFRRHPRLFLPAVVLCVPSVLIAYLGLYGNGRAMPGAAVPALDPPICDTLWAQILDFGREVRHLTDLFAGNADGWVYNNALWTLPIEFRSSMVIFGMLTALSRCRQASRMTISAAAAIYALWYIHWGEFLFIGGMLVADLHFLLYGTQDSSGGVDMGDNIPPPPRSPSRRKWVRGFGSPALRTTWSFAFFFLSLFLLGMPKLELGAADAPGYATLAWLIPEHYRVANGANYFWLPLAAVGLVLSIDRSPTIQRVFTTRFAQYLGRISYALYLVHLMLLHSLGFWLGRFFVGLTGSDSDAQYFTGILVAALVLWVVTIWAADLGWRFVDTTMVRFAAWVYGKLTHRTPLES
ncbi:acyltransferase family-domain-containing protein [Xylariomycetidae sp. FL2044]|nr:acyltransferase family-domain-containing protein [Xylariomycetidae sp. FL2044]